MTAQGEGAPASDPLLDSSEQNVHERIQFVQFGPAGDEEVVVGYIWSKAPNIRGMRCYWVLIIEPTGAVRARPAVAVAVVARRHRVGRLARTRAGATYWLPRAGRYVDIGTAYTETDPRSATGLLTAYGADPPPPPTRIMVPPLTRQDLTGLFGDNVDQALLP